MLRNRRAQMLRIALALVLLLEIARGCEFAVRIAVTTEESAEHVLYQLQHTATTRPVFSRD